MSMTPGIHENIPNHVYHADDAVGKSRLWNMRRSPAYYRWALDNPPKQTESMAFGSAVHTLFLESDKFHDEYAIFTDGDRRGKAWEYFKDLHYGKTILKSSEMEPITDCVTALRHQRTVIDGGVIEMTAVWKDGETGILCKCRPDVAHPSLLLDLKTTTSINASDFARSCATLGYDLQAHMYCEGIYHATGERPSDFYFLAVESSPPYLSAIMRTSIEMMASGEVKFRKYLRQLAECIEKNHWPGPESLYQDGHESILINWPSWA
jgi:exodeoxyribonuclease VIII